MNKSTERAEALARAEKLVREANSRKANLEGIADLLQCNHPEEIAGHLLEVYFEVVYLMTITPQYDDSYLGEHLYMLKDLYKAFAQALKPSEVSISLTVTEEPESLR